MQSDKRRGPRCDNMNLRKFFGTRDWQRGEGKKTRGNEGRHEGAAARRRNQVLMVQRSGKRRQNRWNTKEGGSRKRVMIYKPHQQQYGGRGEGANVKEENKRRLILYRPQHQPHQQQQYGGGGGGGAFGELVSKKVDKITKLMSLFSSRQQPLHAPQTHWRTACHSHTRNC